MSQTRDDCRAEIAPETDSRGGSDPYRGRAGASYFELRAPRRASWVQAIGSTFFQPFVSPSDTVLDFGCGSGEILSRIESSRRIGIEVNEPSRREAEGRGIEVHESIGRVPDASVDVVISHHALEHVLDPAAVARELLRVLRPGGKAVIVVPAQNPRRSRGRTWHDELEKHLYSWSPQTLGNLLAACGFQVEQAFIREFGYSRYLLPIRRIPLVYPLALKLLAFAADRYHAVCVALRPVA